MVESMNIFDTIDTIQRRFLLCRQSDEDDNTTHYRSFWKRLWSMWELRCLRTNVSQNMWKIMKLCLMMKLKMKQETGKLQYVFWKDQTSRSMESCWTNSGTNIEMVITHQLLSKFLNFYKIIGQQNFMEYKSQAIIRTWTLLVMRKLQISYSILKKE